MTQKYVFMCTGGHINPTINFVADHFLYPRSEYLDLLSGVHWHLTEEGQVRYECGNNRWPKELSKRYFTSEARRFAHKVLGNKMPMPCHKCGEDIEVSRV